MKNKKKISIIGLGVSGLAVAEKLYSQGEMIFISERKSKKEIDKIIINKIESLKIPAEFGEHSNKVIQNTKSIVVSPGVNLDQNIFIAARKKKIPLISEVELAFSFINKPIIAITGTNGKTTTVVLTDHILNKCGFRSIAAGNIGYPLMKVNDQRCDYIVAEISSYQLETINNFKPWISVILNISDDHLIRHKNIKNYTMSKARIFENQGKSDYLVFNYDDPIVKKLSLKAKCIKIPFSIKKTLKNGIFIKNNKVVSNISGRNIEICGTSQIKLKGTHNLQNALAAIAASIISGADKKKVSKALKGFDGVEHRMEYVTKIKGVAFYNDSKGTNTNSTMAAIDALYPENKLILILGGTDKKTNLINLGRLVKQKVKNVVLIGEAAKRFKADLEDIGYKKIRTAKTMDNAVRQSFSLANKGDAVLLSPACASFDMFKNYEERGRIFKSIVNRLAKENS